MHRAPQLKAIEAHGGGRNKERYHCSRLEANARRIVPVEPSPKSCAWVVGVVAAPGPRMGSDGSPARAAAAVAVRAAAVRAAAAMIDVAALVGDAGALASKRERADCLTYVAHEAHTAVAGVAAVASVAIAAEAAACRDEAVRASTRPWTTAASPCRAPGARGSTLG